VGVAGRIRVLTSGVLHAVGVLLMMYRPYVRLSGDAWATWQGSWTEVLSHEVVVLLDIPRATTHVRWWMSSLARCQLGVQGRLASCRDSSICHEIWMLLVTYGLVSLFTGILPFQKGSGALATF